MKKDFFISAISHPVRKRIIEILADAPRTVSEIVILTGQNQPTVSSHLSILSGASIVDSYPLGRERIYRLIPEEFEELVGWLDRIIHARDEKHISPLNKRSQVITELHYARTCYDHLAGVAGVSMLDELLTRKWLLQNDDGSKMLAMTSKGESGFANIGVNRPLRKGRKRIFAYTCMDWTVRRFHLGGKLGFDLLKQLESSGYILRVNDSRKVIMKGEIKDFLDGVLL